MADTTNSNLIHHGGDTYWARQIFTYNATDWLDLSTGINAAPYPLPPLSDKAAHLLPQGDDYQKLLEIASSYYQAHPGASLAMAPGSQALIQWLPQLCDKGTTVIVGPTYMEHENCWKNCEHTVVNAPNLKDALSMSPDVIVLVNPNNPTGTQHTAEYLLSSTDTFRRRGGLLIIDEAFGDVAPNISAAPYAGIDGLIILRSFGKFFGLAGIRLGIAITNDDWAIRLNTAIGPWAISGLTIEIAKKAFQDSDWIAKTSLRLANDQQRMNKLLMDIGMSVVGGCGLFTLVEESKAPELFQHLGNTGIMVRHFPNNKHWLRFGFPGTETDWRRLEKALAQYQQL